jgi:hypothetical protein
MRKSLLIVGRDALIWSRATTRNLAAALLLTVHAAGLQAADTYQSGRIVNITTLPQGLLLMLDSGPPTSCAGTSYGWMLIPETAKTMVATTLLLWFSGSREITVYVGPYSGSGYCNITQLDPA